MNEKYPATLTKSQSIAKLQKKIWAIENEIVRHVDMVGAEGGAKWFDEMADMFTERNDLKKMLKKRIQNLLLAHNFLLE